MTSLPDAIIFDLDDTILDDSGSVDACWREVCDAAALRIDGIHPDTLLAEIERHRDWFWSDPARHREGRLDLRAATTLIVTQAFEGLGLDRPDLAREIAEAYRDAREARLCPLPGAVETIEHFRSSGVRLGMATNGSAVAQRAKIERFGLAKYFERIIIEGEFGLGKPHREVYEALFASLGADPSKTWAVGDNLEWDVGAPQSHGAYGIWVDGAARGVPARSEVNPDRIVRSIRELL